MALFLPLAGGASLVAASAAAGIYYATYAVRSQWLGQTVWHGRRETRAVSLTFDDGPSEDTARVLEILAANNLRATFFMMGRNVQQLPRIAQQVAAAGHEIGNHSFSHPIYLFRSPRETREQLEVTQSVIRDTTGVRPDLARPPCGVRTPAYFRAASELGLRTVLWDVAGFDWKRRTADEIAARVLRGVRAGSIILLHDGDSEGKQNRRETVLALRSIIGGLRGRDLRIVPLAQLLSEVKLAA